MSFLDQWDAGLGGVGKAFEFNGQWFVTGVSFVIFAAFAIIVGVRVYDYVRNR